MTPSLTEQLAAGVLASAANADRSHAVTLLTDFLVCARAGEPGVDLLDAPAVAAAAHVHDRDDVHWETLVHCGSIVWPVVLWAGDRSGATGAELLAAAALGYETMVRTARFLGAGHRTTFHATTTAGTVAAAATAAYLGGDPLVDALGHAVSVMGGSAQTVRERSDTRLFHRSHAVRTGLAAAAAARAGLHATKRGLEQFDGDPAGLTGAAEPALATTSVRLFRTSGWNQAAYAAALEAARPVEGSITGIEVEVAPAVADISTGPQPSASDRPWSLEWSVAAAIDIARAESLARLVRVRPVPSPALAATVRITGERADGAASAAVPPGHPERPATRAQLLGKWGESAQSLHRISRQALDSVDRGAAGELAARYRRSTKEHA